MDLTLQPFIIVVGIQMDQIRQSIVVLNDVLYECDNFLRAIDLCFKIFSVFNVEYPPEARSSWMFIQKYVYDINEPDLKIAEVTRMIKTLSLK